MLKNYRVHRDSFNLSGYGGDKEHWAAYWEKQRAAGKRKIPEQQERYTRIDALIGGEEAEGAT